MPPKKPTARATGTTPSQPKQPSKAPPNVPRKAAPKAPKPVEEQLKRHFNSLSAQIDGGHFKNAIKTCNKILRLVPDDKDALDSKLFLLIQTDQYEAALELIKELPGPSDSAHLFEQAYLLYRLQKEDEAAEMVKRAQEAGEYEPRALSNLEAQIKYRQTDYEGAKEIYNELLDTIAEETEEHPDLLTNLNATQAHLDFLSSGYLAALNSLDISVGVLEDTGAPPLPGSGVTSSLSTALQQSKSTATTEATPAAPNPPRPSRLPKHVILGVTPMPDPERWLKKRERTTVQGGGRGGKKGRRKEGMGVGATQGLALPAEKERATSSGPTGGSVPTSSRGGGGKKGKKGR
ncbi:hypothetical protein FRC04_004503 [Tulasnella sp. 424]|nr:hypothetical protein FRC04_004503 [Tulasnella sp. 424]KAG8976572.1 hypothetical protein FRC05_003411 [Tulasnella sp. 425]